MNVVMRGGMLNGTLSLLPCLNHLSSVSSMSVRSGFWNPFILNPLCSNTPIILVLLFQIVGWDSWVGIATGYGLDGPGIESWWGRDFPHLSRPALGPTQPPVQCVPVLFWGVKSGRGVTLTTHSLLVPWSWNGRAIPLLFLLAVRPVEGLSTCKRVHFTFTFTRLFGS
jgi:hypothetical protein